MYSIFIIARKGKAHLIMKSSFRPRRTKEEIEKQRQDQEEEKKEINSLRESYSFLESKGIRAERVPEIVTQNEKLIHYLQEKNLLDENGSLKK